MENAEHQKPITIKMKYPTPYSQSWSNTEPTQDFLGRVKRCPSVQGNRRKLNQTPCNCCWTRPKPLTHGSNPYAPHLKYGLFPRRVVRERPNSMVHKPLVAKMTGIEDIHIGSEKFIKDRRKVLKKENPTEAPLFIIRPIDKHITRQLSLSGVTHVDVKPRRNVHLARKISPLRFQSTHTANRFVRNKHY